VQIVVGYTGNTWVT